MAGTGTFRAHFGEENGIWKVAGLAWGFKNGLIDMKNTKQKHYWAGGFLWGGQGEESESHLDEFIKKDYWKTGYSRGETDKKHTDHWALFDQIAVGDEFAIKGDGARKELKIYYVGTVKKIDQDEGIIRLDKLDRKLFHGKAPSAGNGSNWFGTIVSVTNPDAIRKVFYGETGDEEPQLPDACLNTILFGPPGTGKTYQSTHMAVELADGGADGLTPAQKQERFDALLDEGRVAFITFHQSFAYEDFVEGIRPVLDKDAVDGTPRYECKDGIFKRIAIEALYAALERPESGSREAEFEARWTEFTNQIEEKPEREYEGLTEKTRYMLTVSPQRNVIAHNVKNPDASFYTCSRRNMKKVFLAHYGKKEISIREINDTLGVGSHAHLATVVYHALADVDATEPKESERIPTAASYEERKQIVLEYLEHRDDTGYSLMLSNRAPRYVLVIDEINRGNISKILGEHVTLLEPDKRIGAARQLRATLPYSGEVFGVPENLYIVGTMNTADKSIALVDVALRRRFEFEEFMPDFSVCSLLPAEIRNVLVELNRRISLRKDRDHQIGHSYFMAVPTTEEFNRQFEKTTIPLLQEYFFNDWDGLRFVLGEAQKDEGVFIRSTDHGGSKWARNRWQWFSDVDSHTIDYLAVLKKNFAQQGGGQQDEE